ncbi:MAG: hypothetical protein EOP86_23980, partial [Verrucomicrobiaceae bacterium]
GLTGVVAIAAGQIHSLALKDDGTVAAWGYECTVPAGLCGVVAIAAEGHYSLALKSDGTLVSWGQTYNRIAEPTGVTEAAAGAQHSLALKSDGTVVAWGSNYHGEGQVPTGLAGVVKLAAGANYSLALKSDRTLAVWGNTGDIPAAGVPEVAAVSAGINGALALLGTPGRPPAILGSMRVLATGGYGSFRYRIATASPAASFAAAGLPPGLVLDTATGFITGTATRPGRYSVALSATNGHGTDQRKLILTVTGKPAWVEGGVPENWTVGLPTAARVLASGDAVFSAIGLPPGTGIDPATGAITGAPSLPGLYSVTFSLTNPLGTTVKTVDIGVSNIHMWGPGNTSLIYPPDPKNTTGHVPAGISCAVAIAAGRGHTVALSSDGAVYSWSRPGFQLEVPSSLDGVRVKAIAAGPYHSLAVREDGTVVSWGDSFCVQMLAGDAPQAAGRVDDVPAYVYARERNNLPAAALLALPLTAPDGEVVGTLCAASRHRLNHLEELLPTVQVQANMLGALLAHELRLADEVRRAERAEHAAHTDALTEVGNRRSWDAALAAEETRAA